MKGTGTMKRSSIAAGIAVAGLIVGGASLILARGAEPAVAANPPVVDGTPPAMPSTAVAARPDMETRVSGNAPQPPKQIDPPRLVSTPTVEVPPSVAASSVPVWRAIFETGDTLDALLSRAGIDAGLRAEIALALGAEYDLRRFRPGHRLDVHWAADGAPARIILMVENGVTVKVDLDGPPTVDSTIAETVQREAAGEIPIDGSVYASLDRAGLPVRFAVDLAQVLGDMVDLRRDLQGGERLRITWSEAVTVDGAKIGAPQMTYAALDLGNSLYEIVWSDEGPGRASLFRDGEVMRTVAPPVEGARLSSVFGSRRHPVYGDVRMHTGVDYAARRGAPVSATAPGRVLFIGWRGGYGRVVELSHGSDTMTRYAHLSDVPGDLSVGDRVGAGDLIGLVGATGTATGPNLHYEVRVDGRPIDPLDTEMFAAVETTDFAEASLRLREERDRFASVAEADG